MLFIILSSGLSLSVTSWLDKVNNKTWKTYFDLSVKLFNFSMQINSKHALFSCNPHVWMKTKNYI